MSSEPIPLSEGKTFLGHPRGLYVLFFAEMWERFSYYGMRVLLVFYLIEHWLYSKSDAYGIYGAYTALVYILPVVGGYLADRYLGKRKAVQYGAVLLVIGHGLMAFEGLGPADNPALTHADMLGSPYFNLFWLALAFIVMGVGFLKANISSIVGDLYGKGDPRRDSGFTIFYMGINVGAATGIAIASYLGRTYGWNWGFGAAGLGMFLGLVVFVWGRPALLGRGESPNPERLKHRTMGISFEWMLYLSGIVGVAVVWVLIQYQDVVGGLLAVGGAAVVAYILWTCLSKLDRIERQRIYAALFLIALQPLFWALFEQAGSSLNVYTLEEVDRTFMGMEVPPGMFQSLNPIYIILLAPFFAWFWVWLNRKGWEPSTPAKFGIGLMLLGSGFLVLVAGAAAAGPAVLTPVIFIFLIYLLHTMGELCLSPIGLSAMTKLAPVHMVSLMMGTWFLSTAGGNYIGGMIAQATGGHGAEVANAVATPVLDVYQKIGWVAIAVGVGVILVSPLVKKLMHEDLDKEHFDNVLAGQHEIGEPAAAGTRTDNERRSDRD